MNETPPIVNETRQKMNGKPVFEVESKKIAKFKVEIVKRNRRRRSRRLQKGVIKIKVFAKAAQPCYVLPNEKASEFQGRNN